MTKLPVVPLIGAGTHRQYLAHEADLAALVARLIEDGAPSVRQPIVAAHEEGRSFREILAALAAAHGRRVRFLPVPWRLPWAGLKVAEALRLNPGFRSDSVVSLVNQDPDPDFTATRAVGVPFRAFQPASPEPVGSRS